MGFKRLRGVPLPYEKQGQIYFTCQNYETAPKYTRLKIDKLCESAGGEYSLALKELVTSAKTAQEIAIKHHISVETLTRRRKVFYILWQR